jgi:Ca-activated chloride channel family protein
VTFQWPLALLALAVLPALAALYVLHERRRGTRAARWAAPALLPNLVTRAPGRLRHVPFALFLAALALLLVGAARPHATVKERAEDATVVLAVDTSRSMAARDVRPTRLAAARAIALQFLDGVPSRYRVAVVAFASRATAALPPTTDRSLARAALRSLRPGLGTALGDAVDLATRISRRAGAAPRGGKAAPTAVLLISDGVNEVGRVSPATAARRARARRIRVYSVLVGTAGGVVERPLPGGFTEVVRVPSSPETLRAIAATTGGRFFTARNDAQLDVVHEDLKSQLGKRKTKRELTDVFAAGSAALLIVGGSLSALWFRRLP